MALHVYNACGASQSYDIDGSETESCCSAVHALVSVEEPLDWPHEVNGVVR